MDRLTRLPRLSPRFRTDRTKRGAMCSNGIIRKLIDQALHGDVSAAREVLNRTLGKPVEMTESNNFDQIRSLQVALFGAENLPRRW